jgi:hypothetical protein
LAQGGPFKIRALNENDQGDEEDLKLIPTPRNLVEVTNIQLPTLELDGQSYYAPSFAVVDSWDDSRMFQITVSASHAIKSNSKQFKALKKLGVPGIIIFVVPQSMVNESTNY